MSSRSKLNSRLERSRLDAKAVQRELMHNDLDMEKLAVYLKSKIRFDDVGNILDAGVSRTMEGSDTISIKLSDTKRKVIRSGLLNNKLDIQVDGLWFRLYKVGYQGDTGVLQLDFETREIAVLRQYDSLKYVHRSHATRAEFVLNLIREVKEFHIPVVIPELHTVQEIQTLQQMPGFNETVTNKYQGVPTDVNSLTTETNRGAIDQTEARGTARMRPQTRLTVKGNVADREQIAMANIIIATGKSMNASRKVIVCAIMTAAVESSIRNLPYGDRDSLGLFQQRANWGSEHDRLDPATSSRLFYLQAIALDKQDPTIEYGGLCQSVQNSAYPDRYAVLRTEADRWVSAAGIIGVDTETSAASANTQLDAGLVGADFLFYRGDPSSGGANWKKENSWSCIQRLADEVNWRAFFVSGVFYWIAEDELIKSMPVMTLEFDSEGTDGFDGDYNVNKKSASVSLNVRTGKWTAPPGSVVVLRDSGPFNGRWLMSEFDRSFYDSEAQVILVKARPRLPEPAESNIDPPGGLYATPDVATDAPGAASAPLGEAVDLAKELLLVAGVKWKDDNGRGLNQIRKVAAGQQLNGAEGLVSMDPGPLRAVLWLINTGYTIGTYAWCEDHHDDGSRGHTGGYAVDISSINGEAIAKASPTVRQHVIEVMKLFRNAHGIVGPRQLICGGYGNHRDMEISNLSIPAADSYYGSSTMQQHTNHIHVGY